MLPNASNTKVAKLYIGGVLERTETYIDVLSWYYGRLIYVMVQEWSEIFG